MRLRTILALLIVGLAPAHGQEPAAQVPVQVPIQPSLNPARASVRRDASALENHNISRIDFVPTEQPLPRDELDRLLLPMRLGQPLHLADSRTAIERLYSTGRYADISIDAQADGESVILHISTELTYYISSVTVSGEQEPPNQNQLVTASQLEIGALYRADALPESASRMTTRLQANGLYQASVQQKVSFIDSTEEAAVEFDIHAGPRAVFSEPQLSGEFQQSSNSLIGATGWHNSFGWISLPGWHQVTENRVQSGIDNLRKKLQGDDRLQAQVILDRLDYNSATNRVTPYLTIASGPIIEVRVTGTNISRNRLRDLVPIYQQRSVDRTLLLEGQRSISDYLQSEGYFDAIVTFNESEPAPGQFVVEYNVMRGERHKLVAIQIIGNGYFDYATLRERMYVQAVSWLRWRHGRYSPSLLQRDEDAVRNLYRANGFRDVKVTADVHEDSLDHTNLSVLVRIEEGPQSFVKSLQVEGIPQEDADYLRSVLRSTEGQPYSESNVAADRDAILAYFFNNGYLEAAFDSVQEVSPDPNQVDVRYTIRTGTRQYVRNVLVRGLVDTDPMLVSSRIRLVPGGPVSQSQIGESQQKLYDLGIFARVQTAVQDPDGVEDRKNVIFSAQEARKYSFNFGVGAEIARIGGGTQSLSDPAGATGFAPRVSVGVSRINFMGLGHTIGLQTLASTQQRRVLVNYLAPQFKGKETLALTFSGLFNDARDVRTFAARRWETSVQLAQKFSRANTGQIRFTFRRVTLDENSLAISPELIPLLSRPVRVGLIGGSFFQDRRDDPTDSHRGVYNSIDLAGAAKAFGSQTSFTRVLLRNSTYYQIHKDVVLARSMQFGYIQRLGGQPEIPLAERFFAGGASSQRAFPDNQAGPRDPITGFPLGGNALLFHSTELRFPLIGDNLGGVLFHDMGNVYSDVRNISFRLQQHGLQDFNYMVHAVGMGVRYRTPIGPVRVDLAYGPNTPRFFGFSGTRDQLLALPPSESLCVEQSPLCTNQRISRFQFHFSLGQTF